MDSGKPEEISLGNLDQINNLDTARMALRWAIERVHALENEKEALALNAQRESTLRSRLEDRWRAAHQAAGSGALDALREADPELVAEDSERLGSALRRILDSLPDGGSALVVGHSPMNEAAVLGLTGQVVAPLAKGAGVRLVTGRPS